MKFIVTCTRYIPVTLGHQVSLQTPTATNITLANMKPDSQPEHTHLIEVSFDNVNVTSQGFEEVIGVISTQVPSAQDVLDTSWNLQIQSETGQSMGA